MYTLKSIKNGKFLSSLFSDKHNETFNSRSLDDCYTWNSLEKITQLRDELGFCMIVKIN